MSGFAYISGNDLHVTSGGDEPAVQSLSYPLGEGIVSFLRVEESFIERALDCVRRRFHSGRNQGDSDNQIREALRPYVLGVQHQCPYLSLYMEAYIDELYLSDGSQSPENIEVMLTAILGSQARLDESVSLVFGEELQDTDETLALYCRAVGGEKRWTYGLRELPGIELDEGGAVANIYDIGGIEELWAFELLFCACGGVTLRKCVNCGGWFAVRGRRSTLYCGYAQPGTERKCSEIGALRKYKQSRENDPAYEEYKRAYKRNHARRRAGKISAGEFESWSREAGLRRDACDMTEAALEEYKAWLYNN